MVPSIPADSAAAQLLPRLNLLEGSRILGPRRHLGAWLGHELLPIKAKPPAVQANVASILSGMGVQNVVVAAVPAPCLCGRQWPIVYGLRPGFSLHVNLTMALLACGEVACLEQWMHLYPPPSEATTRCGPQVRISPLCKSLTGPPRNLSRMWRSPTRANRRLLCSPPGVADPPSAPHLGS